MNYTAEMIQAIGLWRDFHQVWIADNIAQAIEDAELSFKEPGVYIYDYPEVRELTPWCYFSLVMSYDAKSS